MKKFFALAAVLMLCGFCVAQAKGGPKTVAQILDGGVTAIETELVPAAEAMPEDKFGFAPTNGDSRRPHLRPAGEARGRRQLPGGRRHPGRKATGRVRRRERARQRQVQGRYHEFLKDSFAYAHKAVATITADNSTASIDSAFGDGKTTRLGMATVIAWHGFDHYGQMVEYLRMNGIVRRLAATEQSCGAGTNRFSRRAIFWQAADDASSSPPVASAVLRDLGENEFGGQFALGEMGGDSLLRLFAGTFGPKHEHRRTRSAQASAENARISDQFLDRRKQWTKRRAIG